MGNLTLPPKTKKQASTNVRPAPIFILPNTTQSSALTRYRSQQ